MILEVSWDGLWRLSFGLSQFHGHGSWLVCEVALSCHPLVSRWWGLPKIWNNNSMLCHLKPRPWEIINPNNTTCSQAGPCPMIRTLKQWDIKPLEHGHGHVLGPLYTRSQGREILGQLNQYLSSFEARAGLKFVYSLAPRPFAGPPIHEGSFCALEAISRATFYKLKHSISCWPWLLV
jgi:hypothetical protein